MKHQEMNLNIWIDLADEIWNKVPSMYQLFTGWIGYGDGEGNGEKYIPYWFSFNENEKHISASVEPSGIQFSGLMREDEWNEWRKEVKIIASQHLGFKVGEVELGEVGYDIEYL